MLMLCPAQHRQQGKSSEPVARGPYGLCMAPAKLARIRRAGAIVLNVIPFAFLVVLGQEVSFLRAIPFDC